MSTANELLRRALESFDWMDVDNSVTKDIRAFLAVEPEVEYDLSEVIPLTHRKSKGIIKDKGYHVTGFVLARPDGDKCIVDMSAVRWLTDKEFFGMMHPPVVSPTAEPEADKPVAWMHPNGGVIQTRLTGLDRDTYTIPLYTRPEQSRKPMTKEEIIAGVTHDTSDDFHAGYWAGVRFAEKHHGIGGSDE